MSPLEDCCPTCVGCSAQRCIELGEFCDHESPLCIPSGCCEREHERSAA